MLLRQKPNQLEFMRDLACKICWAGDLVLDTLAGTSQTAKAFWLLPEHSRFVGCKTDSACLQDALLGLVEVYAKQVWSLDFVIARSEEEVEARRAFLKLRTVFASNEMTNIRTLLSGLVLRKKFIVHIVHFLRNVYKNETLFEKCRHAFMSKLFYK